MKRTKIVAGNWKMNTTYEEGMALAKAIIAKAPKNDTEIILAPPFTHMLDVHRALSDKGNIFLAAQNCHHDKNGAHTGEISVEMLKSVGVDYIIIGHSERRATGEDHKTLAKKVNLALQAGMRIIFCCGEPLTVREDNAHIQHVKKQLRESLFHLYESEFKRVVIAYEPVWAIGTGKTASPAQAQEMHREIRKMIANSYDEPTANSTSILYGGSVKPSNSKELFSQEDVDGGLIGGASLKAESFISIVQ